MRQTRLTFLPLLILLISAAVLSAPSSARGEASPPGPELTNAHLSDWDFRNPERNGFTHLSVDVFERGADLGLFFFLTHSPTCTCDDEGNCECVGDSYSVGAFTGPGEPYAGVISLFPSGGAYVNAEFAGLLRADFNEPPTPVRIHSELTFTTLVPPRLVFLRSMTRFAGGFFAFFGRTLTWDVDAPPTEQMCPLVNGSVTIRSEDGATVIYEKSVVNVQCDAEAFDMTWFMRGKSWQIFHSR